MIVIHYNLYGWPFMEITVNLPSFGSLCICRCQQISKKVTIMNCNACRSSLSLATCLDCDTVLCDKWAVLLIFILYTMHIISVCCVKHVLKFPAYFLQFCFFTSQLLYLGLRNVWLVSISIVFSFWQKKIRKCLAGGKQKASTHPWLL